MSGGVFVRLGRLIAEEDIQLSIMKTELRGCCVPDRCCSAEGLCFDGIGRQACELLGYCWTGSGLSFASGGSCPEGEALVNQWRCAGCEDVVDEAACAAMAGSYLSGVNCSSSPCSPRPGLCCHCVQGFYYFTFQESGDDSRTFLGSPPFPFGIWTYSTRVYRMPDMSYRYAYNNAPAPEGGVFVSKYLYTGDFKCAFAESVLDSVESYWGLTAQQTACSDSSREDCERCRGGVHVGEDNCGVWTPNPDCALKCCNVYIPWTGPPEGCGCPA